MKTLYLLILFFNILSCNVMKKQEIEIIGTSENTKIGAVVISKENNEIYYLDGLKSWQENERGKLVTVTGLLSVTTTMPQEENNPIIQQIVGEKKTILKPKWKFGN